jgi:hypothetical protein
MYRFRFFIAGALCVFIRKGEIGRADCIVAPAHGRYEIGSSVSGALVFAQRDPIARRTNPPDSQF